MWIVAYTVNDNENSLNEDHYETFETEQEARGSYAMIVANTDNIMCACVAPILEATEPHWKDEKTINALALVDEIAREETWTEAENGSDDSRGFGSITREFQEAMEEQAHEWIDRARVITGYAPPEPEEEDELLDLSDTDD